MFYDHLLKTLKDKERANDSGSFPGDAGLNRMIKDVHKYSKMARARGARDAFRSLSDPANQLIMQKLHYAMSVKTGIAEVNEAKLFLLDYPTVDALYHEKHGNLNYPASIHLPFPFMFFELSEPYPVMRATGEEDQLIALLFRKQTDAIRVERMVASHNRTGIRSIDDSVLQSMKSEPTTDAYRVSLFYGNEKEISDMGEVSFNISTLPSFSMLDGATQYLYDHTTNVIASFDIHAKDISFLSGGMVKTPAEIDNVLDLSLEKNNKIKSSLNTIDLVLNTINYINAQNIEIKSGSTHRVYGHRTGFTPTKPYYWVEVRKKVVEPSEQDERSWTLNYRVWVRGHFRHYQDGACIWIDPYVKGPEGAPWKENRYKMLYERTIQPYLEAQS